MGRNREKIIEGLRRITEQRGPDLLSATVTSTDEGDATMVAELTSGEEIEGIMLNGIADELNGIVPIPEDGSDVVIGTVDGGSTYVLVKASKLKKLLIKCEEVTINDGGNKGLVRLEKLEDNLKAIKDYLTTLNTAIGAAFTAVGAGTAANGPAGKTSFDGAMASQKIQYQDMENQKVKH